jgi:hypothetical protein
MADYIKIIGEFFPTAEVTLTSGGSPTVYNDIVWVTTPITQSVLDTYATQLETAIVSEVVANIVTPVTGQSLVFDGTKYVNNKLQLSSANFSNINITSPTNGQTLVYNGSMWVNSASTAGVTSVGITGSTGLTVSNSPITSSGNITLTLQSKLQQLANMTSVGVPYVSSTNTLVLAIGGANRILACDSTGNNIAFTTVLPSNILISSNTATAPGIQFTASSSLLSTPINNAIEWVNSNLYLTSTTGTRQRVAYAGVEGEYSLTQLSDVTLTSPTTNQVLQYNGTQWVNTTLSTAGVTSVGVTGSTGLSVSGSPITSSGTISLTLDTGLQNLSTLNTTGIVVSTSADNFTTRTLTGTLNQIAITNGNGVSNNPAISLANDVILPGTGAVTIPSGTSAQQPTPTNSQMRFNTAGYYEVSIANQWYPIQIQNTSSTAVSSLLFDDMISADNSTTSGSIQHGSSLNWMTFLSGTGAATNNSTFGVDNINKAIGVLTVETGTTNSGRCALTLGDTQILFGFCSFSCEWRVAVNALATTTQNYNLYVGFFDNSNAAGDAVDGVYFKFSRTNNINNWVAVTSNNSTRTIVDTGTPIVANTYIKLRIDVNDTGTEAKFYINGVLVSTIATNIPTGAGRYTGLGYKIEKTAGNTNRISYMDYISVGYTYTTAR